MVEPTILDHLPLLTFFLVSLIGALCASEWGYQLGRRRNRSFEAEKKEVVNSIVGAMFGLLAFLLAFTFGLAASRYDTRRELHQQEVNAIRATYLRTSLMPDTQGAKARELLRKYVDLQLQVDAQEISFVDAARQAEKIELDLWLPAVEIGRNLEKKGAPNSDMLALYLDAQSQMIDAHSKRVSAIVRARVPAPIWAGLIILALVANFIGGYHIGIVGVSRPLVGVGMIFCLAITLYLIADLDRPFQGLIQVNHRSMFDLRAWMTEQAP